MVVLRTPFANELIPLKPTNKETEKEKKNTSTTLIIMVSRSSSEYTVLENLDVTNKTKQKQPTIHRDECRCA